MSFVNSQKGKRFDMTKKIIPNQKYEHVQHTVDTGSSMSKYMRKIEDIRQNYKYRKNEIFKRMKVTTFVQLLIQVERISGIHDEYESIPPTPASQRPDTADHALDQEVQMIQGIHHATPAPSLALTDGDYGYSQPDTQRSSLQSVMRGIGEMDVKKPEPTKPVPIPDECPYLLLDVREASEYEMAHIITAYCYPKAMLSRATNYESKEMLEYRNKEGKIIIVYDENENIAPSVATTLAQRGYDNIFMLSGGMKIAAANFKEGLFTGTLPPSISKNKPSEFEAATQTTFTAEDVNKLEIYLDSALADKSLATPSRLSQPSSRNSNVSRRSNTSSSVSHRKPFIPP